MKSELCKKNKSKSTLMYKILQFCEIVPDSLYLSFEGIKIQSRMHGKIKVCCVVLGIMYSLSATHKKSLSLNEFFSLHKHTSGEKCARYFFSIFSSIILMEAKAQQKFWRHKPHYRVGVNFINILRAAFVSPDPESTQKTDNLTVFLCFWDLCK